jgi:putative transposase
VSVARFVADQRTIHRVPHTCAILGISISWFYTWCGRGPTERARRRAALDARVRALFEASKRTYGSPRIHADLLEAGEPVSVNTVAESMRRQGLAGRKPKRCRGLTRQDKSAPKFPDLVRRDFSASAPNVKWCGDITEIPTADGKLYFASVLDLHSRRLLASATSDHPDAALACDAIKMAAAVRGGRAAIDRVIFHSDRGSTYTATAFVRLCRKLGVSQSMGRVGSCFDNAAAEAFFSTLEHEVLSRHHFATKVQARQVVVAWCQDFYNTRRRHSSAALMSPNQYERLAADQPAAA